MRFIRYILPHVAIALLLGLLVLVVLDGYNPLMAFLTSPPSKVYMVCACVVSLCAMIALLSRRGE